METVITSLTALRTEAERFAQSLAPREGGATLVTLSGDLGAGKTAFTKEVARALGIEEVITSPTFVLEKIYQLPKLGHPMSNFERLIHIDAYRLEHGSELAPLGFDELMRDTGNLVLLEWPEKVAGALPPAAVQISLEVLSDTERKIMYG